MTYATINDGEATPLQISEGTSSVAPSSTKNKRTSSIIVRALMVGTTVGALLLMAGHSKMTMNKTSNVDGMVVVSSKTTDDHPCAPATGTFSGKSCKDRYGWCAGPGESFGGYAKIDDFETCYVSQNGYCWSHSHPVTECAESMYVLCTTVYQRCDPVGYYDGDSGYAREGFWHVSAPKLDGSCGNRCEEFNPTF